MRTTRCTSSSKARGVLNVEGEAIPVVQGQAIFVPAHAEHQFTAYEGLSVLVIFARESVRAVGERPVAPPAGRCKPATGSVVRAEAVALALSETGSKRRIKESSDVASYPASSRPPVETESGAFSKVAALLLGLTSSRSSASSR